jgi:NTP pyrophosphatase (non-canonical NTP hydrolase)
VFGISDRLIQSGVDDPPCDPLDLMQEECAELIQACSKVKRYGYESVLAADNLREEMGDVLFSLLVLAKKLGITEIDIIYEMDFKARKYGRPSVKG